MRHLHIFQTFLVVALATASFAKVENHCEVIATKYGTVEPLKVNAQRSYCRHGCKFRSADDVDCSDYEYNADECNKLTDLFSRRKWLTVDERQRYCDGLCEFSPHIKCYEIKVDQTPDYLKNVDSWINDILVGNRTVEGVIIELDSSTKELWTDLLTWAFPVLFGLVPPLLNQYKYHNVWTAALFTVVCLSLNMFAGFPWSITMHNCLICLLALVHPSNSSQLAESIWTICVLVALFLLSFVSDELFQIGVFTASVIGFTVILYNTFFIKRGQFNMQSCVLILQLWVMLEMLNHSILVYSINTLGGATFRMLLDSVIPTGSRHFWYANSIMHSRSVVLLLGESIATKKIGAFICAFLFQFFLFCGFRACFGANCLLALRYRFEGDVLMHGFLAYLCDFFGPFRAIWRQTFKYESRNTRRWFYAVMSISLLAMEYCSCFEFFCVRLFFSFFDWIFIGSGYQRSMRYLGCEVKFELSFAKRDALPWVHLDLLHEIAKVTRRLVVTKRNGSKAVGTACAISVNGRSMFYTVKHVVDEAVLCNYGGDFTFSPNFESLTQGDDPVMYMRQTHVEAPSIDIITAGELRRIKCVVCINVPKEPGGENDSFLCFSDKFSVQRDTIHVAVNLIHGDSGGPLFAVLDDGELRFAGVVSRGTHDIGGGNVYSCAVSSNLGGNEYSDDEGSELSTFNAARDFNRNRNPIHRPEAWPDPSVRSVRDRMEDVTDFLRSDECHQLQGVVRKSGVFNFQGLLKRDPEREAADNPYFNSVTEQEGDQIERPDCEDDNQHDPGSGNGPGHQSSKKKRKSVNKDKAARKRAFRSAQTLARFLLNAYCEQDAAAIFYAAIKDDIPHHSEREVIARARDGGWIFTD